MKKILITGANFNNKGAQSMLFITVDELRKRYPDCLIWFSSNERVDIKNYKMQHITLNLDIEKILLGETIGLKKYKIYCKQFFKNILTLLRGGRNIYFPSDVRKCDRVLKDVDMILDISGFQLGDKWSYNANLKFINYIRLAQKYHKPIYLMPQSFGPFEYNDEVRKIIPLIQDNLPKAEKIFVREEEGYILLKEQFGLSNVMKSTDLVLQNTEIDLDNIYINIPKLNIPEIQSEKKVGIIPNMKCISGENEMQIISFYEKAIDELVANNYNVVIFYHSIEDRHVCERIYSKYNSSDKVMYIDQDFTCIEYGEFVEQFEFVICSRYHGIVHAYKKGVPCVILGWAIKYKELAKRVNQSKFTFDVYDIHESSSRVLDAINWLMIDNKHEKEIITNSIKKIQEDNCFHEILRN